MSQPVAMPPEGDIATLLRTSRTIAMVGASADPWRPSFGIQRYLRRAGYRVLPVNPNHRGEIWDGETVVGALREISGPVDLVNVFRRSDSLGEVVDDAIGVAAPAIWTQLGIRNDEALARARASGMLVVSDRCISVEHARLPR
ncbi:CoA-binding protein [uncultured Enterovirga sp.]|uniref:CoA-binding protein n=1 Tax=uncultured Enterovirga sp. TaxID=2026352 RepID=UPI0035CA7F5A